MFNKWELFSPVTMERPPGPIACSSSQQGPLVLESAKGFHGLCHELTPVVSPELGALSPQTPCLEFRMPPFFSWACPLFEWKHDVETQSTQQIHLELMELMCFMCTCQAAGRRASLLFPCRRAPKVPPQSLTALKIHYELSESQS